MSFKKYGTITKEAMLPYKMADLYAYTRKFINRKRFLHIIILCDILSIIGGVFIWLMWDQWERQYIVNGDGQVFGLYTYGVFMTMVVVILHHLQVFVNMRNYTWWIIAWSIFSLAMLPLMLWVAQIGPNSQTRKSTYALILKNPTMWLNVLVTTFVLFLPIYFHKKWIQVVRFPQFYKC